MPKIEIICKYCNNTFYDWKSRHRSYCSLRCGKLGKHPWNKGKAWDEDTKKKISISHTGKIKPHIGIAWTEKSKRKVSNTLKKRYASGQIVITDNRRKKCSQNMIHKMKTGIICNEDTLPERLFENQLLFNNILYLKQYGYKLGIADFYLPESNTIVEVDGIYWHSLLGVKERDIKQTNWLEDNDYKVYRFTDKEIKENITKCLAQINH